jgi:DNA-binding MarR family transcriptional regulator
MPASFSSQHVGQAEKALNAILLRLLAEPGLTEHQWITLTLAANSGTDVTAHQIAARVAAALKVSDAEAQARIRELADAGLVRVPHGEGAQFEITEAGQQVYARIRDEVSEITERIWGDLPAEDLETAGRVLSAVRARADAELAST